FSGALSGVNVSQLQSSLASTTVTTTVQGAAPTAAEVATNLTTIAALNGHVSVTGNPGGPYTVALSFTDSSKYMPLSVGNFTGGVMGATNPINGAAGFRVFSV